MHYIVPAISHAMVAAIRLIDFYMKIEDGKSNYL